MSTMIRMLSRSSLQARGRYRRRHSVNALMLGLTGCFTLLALMPLVWIVVYVIQAGAPAITLELFTRLPAGLGQAGGGVLHAIEGTLVVTALASLLSMPVGVLTAFYAATHPNTPLGLAVRFGTDVLAGIPSIVIGLFVYAIAVNPFKTFSAAAGVLALALIVIPVVIRTTENMLQLVPAGLREAAYALGAPKWKVILSITLKAARAGVITGVLLAVARIAGETAPLLFTALSNQFWTSSLGQPMASLPVTIFKFAMSPYENWQKLAWAGVFLITLAVLVLNIAARILSRSKS